MAKMVPAWDKRTGKPVPDPINGGQKQVPEAWLRKGTFRNLTGKAPAKPPTGGKSEKGA